MELEAHQRKCISIQWYKAEEELVTTHFIDKTVKIWDINEGRNDDSVITFTDMPYQVKFILRSPDGKMTAGMIKNKSMVIFDPRQEALKVKAFK